MSLNPLKELKRHLEDDDIPLPKRLCLVRNIVNSHHFPAAPKERVVAEWLQHLNQSNKLTGEELRNVLKWLNVVDDLTSEMKAKLIQIISEYIQRSPITDKDVTCILTFIENEKMASQLQLHISEYLTIVITLLQYLRDCDNNSHLPTKDKILNNIIDYYKFSKKKLEFIIKFLDGENLETIFSLLETESHSTVMHVCKTVLFPINKKSLFVSFLQTLIRKDNIDELMAEKGDNIQSVIKIMSSFFTFPKGRTSKDPKYLTDFIQVFVNSFCEEHQLIFAFYVMATSCFNMRQSYLLPAMSVPPIIFENNDDKIKRNLFLKLLKILLNNEIDISVRLTDSFGEKISKVEIKKNLLQFLEAVMMGQLKLEGKPDKTTIQIIMVALNLDPSLIEHKMNNILPPIMTVKKTNSAAYENYKEMMNCLLEILFKLSRGSQFLNQILPHIKLCLEASNTEQFELKQKIKECVENEEDCEKLKSKIICGHDILPEECVNMFGKWSSELMFRQQNELLVSLQKDFEEYCLIMLEEGYVSPSIITLTEMLSAILCSYFGYNKMAEHTVPRAVADGFWSTFKTFEMECLSKFGKCLLKLNYNPSLAASFLKLCLSYSHLKLLHNNYSRDGGDTTPSQSPKVHDTSQLYDLSEMLPSLNSKQWTTLAEQLQDDNAITLLLNELLLVKMMTLSIRKQNEEFNVEVKSNIMSHLIKYIAKSSAYSDVSALLHPLLSFNLTQPQAKQLAKYLVKIHMNNDNTQILNSNEIASNKILLNNLLLETTRSIAKNLENTEVLCKSLNKHDFDFISFTKEINMVEFFNEISMSDDFDDAIARYVEILKLFQIQYLGEMLQLTAIFVLLAVKKYCHTKKLRQNVDYNLQLIFELCPKYPDMFKIFPVNFLFGFEDNNILDLLTLKIKTSNTTLIVKCILESAVKKVKSDSEIIKNIVDQLIKRKHKNTTSSMEYFGNSIFQITCFVLPIIAREKKAITTSAYRSILANLQEKLHNALLDSFKNIDFNINRSDNIGSVSITENALATLNAIEAYTLTVAKCCETTELQEFKEMDCLWSGLEYFVHNAIVSIGSSDSKPQHVHSSTQLLNVVLRYANKLQFHIIFCTKDKLFLKIWRSVKERLMLVFNERKGDRKRRAFDRSLDEIGVCAKFLVELVSPECFAANFISDLANLIVLKDPSEFLKDEDSTNLTVTSHKVCKYLWSQCLKANISVSKRVAITKVMHNTCKNLARWIWQHYEEKYRKLDIEDGYEISAMDVEAMDVTKIIKIDNAVCDLMKIELDILAEVILSAKKISLDYKFLDSIFQLQHLLGEIIDWYDDGTINLRRELSWHGFFELFEGTISVMNSLLISREEIMEDRWPNYMMCYRDLARALCRRAAVRTDAQAPLQREIEDQLAQAAHSFEKMTQCMCKRKAHISHLAAYSVAAMCAILSEHPPPRDQRLPLHACVATLMQASDSTYSMAFLRRALAGNPAHATLTNLYTMYKKYHKYIGSA